jgi:DNA repair exonuclease SbcCD ATPase subunit
MQFDNIQINNFLSVLDARIDLAGQGLVAIIGENHDDTSAISNGAGKSTIADALFWCLYGETARQLTGDDVVNEASGSGARVQINCADGLDTWRISRYRKYPKLKNALTVEHWNAATSEWDDQTKGTMSMTQKWIEGIIGASKAVFIAAVYSGQEAMPDIPRMTDKELKAIIEEASGTDMLASAAELAREKLRAAQSVVSNAQIQMDRAFAIVERQKVASDDAAHRSVEWVNGRKTVINSAERSCVEALASLDGAKNAFDQADLDSILAGVEDTEKSITAVSGEQVEERRLGALASAAASKAAASLSAAQRLVSELRAAKDRVLSIEDVVGQPCGSCNKVYETKDIEAAKQLALKHQGETATKYIAAKAVAETDQKDAVAHAQTLERYRAGMTDVTVAQHKLQGLRREQTYQEALKRKISEAQAVVDRAKEALAREKAEKNPFVALVERTKKELEVCTGDHKRLIAEHGEAVVLQEYAEAVWSVFAPAGVRAHILDIVTPYLNERTAHYLGSLSDGAIEAFWTTLTLSKDGKNLQEKFSVGVEKKAAGAGFNKLSGGEKRKVRLACALAVQDLVASRAAKPIQLWIGDEIDEALDAAGLERLMTVLEEKARDRGSVLVISHNDIRDYARSTWKVIKSGDVSTVHVV